ncbi:hypothetical protein [Chryseobacterium sp. Leaf394]|nr:hypothetical protein [Chryseobacterium sp. Leaf394]
MDVHIRLFKKIQIAPAKQNLCGKQEKLTMRSPTGATPLLMMSSVNPA